MFAGLLAEFIGSFWLVFCGGGAAILASGFPDVGVGFIGVAFGSGLSYISMAYALGHICGAHFNPALTLGLFVSGRISGRQVIPYWIGQLLGAVAAAAVLYVIASGAPGYRPGGFAANGYDTLSPGSYGLLSAFLVELVMTGLVVLVALGATRRGSGAAALAPAAIGFAMFLAYMIAIPVTGGGINPARSTALAIFSLNGAIWQLWLFWLAPLAGAAGAGMLWRLVLAPGEADPPLPAK